MHLRNLVARMFDNIYSLTHAHKGGIYQDVYDSSRLRHFLLIVVVIVIVLDTRNFFPADAHW